MATTKQLYQLQELDLGIETRENALTQKTAQQGDRRELDEAQGKLVAAQQLLAAQQHRLKAMEDDVADLTSKISTIAKKLYGGKIANPKELTGLQQETTLLQKQRDQRETEALEIMEQVEAAAATKAEAQNELTRVEQAWQQKQAQLVIEIGELQTRLADLNAQRGSLAAGIDPEAMSAYSSLRQKKGVAVARVDAALRDTSAGFPETRNGNSDPFFVSRPRGVLTFSDRIPAITSSTPIPSASRRAWSMSTLISRLEEPTRSTFPTPEMFSMRRLTTWSASVVTSRSRRGSERSASDIHGHIAATHHDHPVFHLRWIVFGTCLP